MINMPSAKLFRSRAIGEAIKMGIDSDTKQRLSEFGNAGVGEVQIISKKINSKPANCADYATADARMLGRDDNMPLKFVLFETKIVQIYVGDMFDVKKLNAKRTQEEYCKSALSSILVSAYCNLKI